jgi:phosphate transport system permease protein
MGSSSKGKGKHSFWSTGEPFVWATAGALSLTLLTTAILIVVVMVNGLGVFWPSNVALIIQKDGSRVLGEITGEEAVPGTNERRIQVKVANRDLYGQDFRWIPLEDIQDIKYPADAVVLERQEYGNFNGFLQKLEQEDTERGEGGLWDRFLRAWRQVKKRQPELEVYEERIAALNREARSNEDRLLTLAHGNVPETDRRVISLLERKEALRKQFDAFSAEQAEALHTLREQRAVFADASGRTKEMPLMDVVRPMRPNAMSIPAKMGTYLAKVWELLSDEPRESNTEGGLFPAIFGTILLIFLMSLFSFPLGVLAAVYLREYAKEGPLVRLVHIAVNNLAGIPSIVYGIFGLGFFVYGVGGTVDQLFFPERLPTPTFGTGGILWASLTLALLTVPVVIVSTEEALSAIPKSIREGSYALGATRFQTLVRTILPMASPGIMTGLILAMARAAGEVAPLMITGVVKMAPALPIDGVFPFVHLDRKFMHLGFHIYDIGFQSPNVEAAKPMVFVTTFLLVLIVLAMSSLAIYLRGRMRRRYAMGAL